MSTTNDVANRREETTSSNDEKSVEINRKEKEIFRTKRSYVPVEIEKRQQLIKAVDEEGLTIKEAA